MAIRFHGVVIIALVSVTQAAQSVREAVSRSVGSELTQQPESALPCVTPCATGPCSAPCANPGPDLSAVSQALADAAEISRSSLEAHASAMEERASEERGARDAARQREAEARAAQLAALETLRAREVAAASAASVEALEGDVAERAAEGVRAQASQRLADYLAAEQAQDVTRVVHQHVMQEADQTMQDTLGSAIQGLADGTDILVDRRVESELASRRAHAQSALVADAREEAVASSAEAQVARGSTEAANADLMHLEAHLARSQQTRDRLEREATEAEALAEQAGDLLHSRNTSAVQAAQLHEAGIDQSIADIRRAALEAVESAESQTLSSSADLEQVERTLAEALGQEEEPCEPCTDMPPCEVVVTCR